jgi:hypothetical protein
MSADIVEAFERQIGWCDSAGSPFTARVLEAALADWRAGGALRELLPRWPLDGGPGDASKDALPLRVAGALHAMALDGSDAAVAALYPPQRDSFDAQAGPVAVSRALRTQRERVADYLQSAPQTNEIGRSAVLLGGFAEVARDTGLPLATLEIGASAGLNQFWHRFRYELGGAGWGDPASPVLIRSDWRGQAPALPVSFRIASQSACDLAPIDLRRPGAALRLESFVWADQRERLERLRAAIALASACDLRVEPADALAWARRELASSRPGQATVLYHSIMWQYLPPSTRDGLHKAIAAAGARATREAPLAWLALEPPPAADVVFELRLTTWPGGESRVLATAHPHGREATWL